MKKIEVIKALAHITAEYFESRNDMNALAQKVWDKTASLEERSRYYSTPQVSKQSIKENMRMIRRLSLQIERELNNE